MPVPDPMCRIDDDTSDSTPRPVLRSGLANSQSRLRGPVRGLIYLGVLVAGLAVLGATGVTERLFYLPSRGPTPPPNHLVGAEKVAFRSKDGTLLVGWFVPCQSPDCDPEHAPIILHAHGNAGSLPTHLGFSDHLTYAGFNLFLFDYRGYGESEGSPTRRGPLIDDTEAALDWVLSQHHLGGSIGLFGQSLGGSIGLNVMAERPEIAAAVVVSAFSSWRDMAADAVPLPRPISTWLAALLISDSHRPTEAIGRIGRPVLLMHGTSDRIVPLRHSRDLLDAAAGDHVRLLELPGADHNDVHLANPQFAAQSIAFFRQHLH